MAGWKPHADLGETQELLKIFRAEDETWALELKENKKVIGSIGLHKSKKQNLGLEYDRELGYVLAEPYWGRGLGSRSGKTRDGVRLSGIGCAHADRVPFSI